MKSGKPLPAIHYDHMEISEAATYETDDSYT